MTVATHASNAFGEYLAHAMIAYVLFVLMSSSLGLWLAASYLSSRWKAYAVATTFAMAVIIIINNTDIPGWLACATLALAIIGPIVFTSFWKDKP